MSYCRFRNTSKDLDDCKDALENLLSGEGKLSRDELIAAKSLVETCQDILALFDDTCADMRIEGVDEFLDAKLGPVLDQANEAASDED
jgi:hypothetical protein